MPKTDVELALAAISEDLDRHVELIAELEAKHVATFDLCVDTRDVLRRVEGKIDEILGFVRPLADRLPELDELRGRIARVDAEMQRIKAS